ncbi:MAG: DUF5666 domain-containing protein, partial [Vicinamibacterales bacterium]
MTSLTLCPGVFTHVRRVVPIAIALVAALTAACGDESANPLAPSQQVLPLSAVSPQFATGPSAVAVAAPSRLASPTPSGDQSTTPLGDLVTLSGVIVSLDPVARTIDVSGKTVVVPVGTITNGLAVVTFADLTIGSQVEVRGTALNGIITAEEVKVVGAATLALTTLSGPVTALTSGCPSVTFDVGATTVVTDGSTVFKNALCVDLAVGMTVEVTGVAAAAGVADSTGVLHALVVERTDADVTLLGPVQGLSGTCPQLSFVVSGVAVTTDFSNGTVGNC